MQLTEVLRAIEMTGSISDACEYIGCQRVAVWRKLRRVEKSLGVRLVKSTKRQSRSSEPSSWLTSAGKAIADSPDTI